MRTFWDMSTVGFIALTAFFAYLTYDSAQFRKSSGHHVWAVPSSVQQKGIDPLCRQEQEGLQANRYTAIGGIPGLHWIVAGMTVGSPVAAAWSVLA